jgi:hypothetical protein
VLLGWAGMPLAERQLDQLIVFKSPWMGLNLKSLTPSSLSVWHLQTSVSLLVSLVEALISRQLAACAFEAAHV